MSILLIIKHNNKKTLAVTNIWNIKQDNFIDNNNSTYNNVPHQKYNLKRTQYIVELWKNKKERCLISILHAMHACLFNTKLTTNQEMKETDNVINGERAELEARHPRPGPRNRG